MIFDNADDVEVLLAKDKIQDDAQAPMASYLPRVGNGKIVVTTRSLNAAEKLTSSGRMIKRIPPMDEPQSLQLLRNKLDEEAEEAEEAVAMELVRALDCIPLAIHQAAAYINRRAPRVTASSYLEQFRAGEGRRKLLSNDCGNLRRRDDVSNSVMVTWEVTFEQIRQESPRAVGLLSLMSCFQPQKVPEYMLHGYGDYSDGSDSKRSDDSENLEDDLDVLQGYSLVSMTAVPGFCEMHPLVQFCTQNWISKFGNQNHWNKLFLGLASYHFQGGVVRNLATMPNVIAPCPAAVRYRAARGGRTVKMERAADECLQLHDGDGRVLPGRGACTKSLRGSKSGSRP